MIVVSCKVDDVLVEFHRDNTWSGILLRGADSDKVVEVLTDGRTARFYLIRVDLKDVGIGAAGTMYSSVSRDPEYILTKLDSR